MTLPALCPNHLLDNSLSTPERGCAKPLKAERTFYIKLPPWLVVKTSISNHDPDWALIKQECGNDKRTYVVVETKSQ